MPRLQHSLVEAFNALGLFETDKGKSSSTSPQGRVSKPVDDSPGPKSKRQQFVGGFDPVLLSLNTTLDGSCRPNSRVVSMPVPSLQISRTMQHALQMAEAPEKPPTPPKFTLAPLVTPSRSKRSTSGSSSVPPSSSSPVSSRAKSPPSISVSGGLSHKATPATPNRPRSTSSPVSATSPRMQCNAITKSTGNQCLRWPKIPPMHIGMDPIPAVYCSQHLKSTDHGFYLGGHGREERLIEFKHYIPTYLKLETQKELKEEMAKPISAADGPGYIYAFEVLEDEPHVIQLKVGRAVKLQKRLDQWNKLCSSQTHIPRGFWPAPKSSPNSDGANGGLLRDHITTGEPGPFCHRVERLVHLELADLSFHAPYLEHGWPDAHNSNQSLSVPSSALSSAERGKFCKDCGKYHTEIFSFRRPENGKYKGREWELIVKPVIEKWGKFVKEHHS